MRDQELIDEFIKVEKCHDNINISVRKIGWKGPHSPYSEWVQAMTLNPDTSDSEIDLQMRKILDDVEYFKICKECGVRNPCGWMHGDDFCKSCAEENHGIVY